MHHAADAQSGVSAATRRALLEERAARFSGRSSHAIEAQAAEPVLLCAVGANLYGLSLDEVAKVRPLATWGSAVASHMALLGMVTEGGRVQPILDLAALLGAEAAPVARGWLIVLSPALRAALRVPELPLAADVEPLADEHPDHMRVVSGPYEGKMLVRLSARALLDRLSQQQGVPSS